MIETLITLLFGPLAQPECARASRRGWVIWLRIFPGLITGVVVFSVFWLWWIGQKLDPNHQPYRELRVGLTIIEVLMMTFALILSPAVLAGSLAGEKERGSIGLLLTTRVNAAEIVLGRLAGKLGQVMMIVLAAIPGFFLFSSMNAVSLAPCLTMLALPASLALGSGGIALATSSMSKRGRDALLLVYLLEVLALLASTGLAPSWMEPISPFSGLDRLTLGDEVGPSLITEAIWSGLGLAGLAVAAWRLRPACLAEGNDRKSGRKTRRFGWVPKLDDRPMLWKELYIERAGSLGRVGRWVGLLIVLWLALGSITLGIMAAWDGASSVDASWANWSVQQLSMWYGNSAFFLCCLIQWAIGLRAAVAISSERERGTWDALLTSPLEGGEIIRAKLWGSLYAIRWLIGSAILAWTIAALYGGILPSEYVENLVLLATMGTFMAALGVRTSLRSASATRAMGLTIGIWLGASILAVFIALAVCVGGMLACLLGYLAAVQFGLIESNAKPWFPMSFGLGTALVYHGQIIGATILMVIETRLRFDRVAGRMTAGDAALAVENLIHGRPMAPVRLDSGKPEPVSAGISKEFL